VSFKEDRRERWVLMAAARCWCVIELGGGTMMADFKLVYPSEVEPPSGRTGPERESITVTA
jgi:hypothetical protein